MSDLGEEDFTSRISRPNLAQVKAIVEFMQKHPALAQRKLRYGAGHAKFKKLWVQLTQIVNSIDGSLKSTKGWIKFWSDKRRSVTLKNKHIQESKQGKLSPLEQKILELCDSDGGTTRRKRRVKQEPCNGNDDHDHVSTDDIIPIDENELDDVLSNECDDRQLDMMEKLVDVMGRQASAMSQMAQANLDTSKSLERLAEASHIQALAVDRIASTFENITSSLHDVRNALLGIDYTMKRCYSATGTQRQNSNIFS